jgi:type IX secretion system PorP/SprF family membrane protein
MKTKIFSFILVLGSLLLSGQQVPIYSAYMFAPSIINPAITGTNQDFSTNLIHRSQWVGIENAPKTSALNCEYGFKNRNIGLGLSIINDQVGIYNNLEINTSYSYHVDFQKSILSFGLQAGISNVKIDYSSVKYSKDETVYDQAFGQNINRTKPIFGTGIYYQSDKFYAGASMPYLRINRTSQGEQANTYYAFATSGYLFELPHNIIIKPSFLIRYNNGAPINIDLNTNIWIKKCIGFGVSYRTNKSIVGMVDLRINRHFRIGFAHDFNRSALSSFTNGSNEIMIKYNLGLENLRYLSMQF